MKKDVNLYFCQVESQYLKMIEIIKEMQKALNEHKMSQEQVEQAMRMAESLKQNYERMACIIMLLNKPKEKKNRSQKSADLYYSWYNSLKYASKEAIIDENKDVLVKLKEILTEVNKNGKENSESSK